MSKKAPPPKMKPFTPFSLYLVIPGFLLYFIFGTLTQPLQNEGLLGEVVGSFRLLFLTMSLFFLLTGLIGYLIYPEDRIKFHNSVKKRILRRQAPNELLENN